MRAVLAWCAHAVPIPEWAVAGLKRGLAGDQSFNQHRPYGLAWLNEFLIHWHGLPEGDRVRLLEDPWAFARVVRGVESSKGAHQPMREAWLYIAFPDAFENISSRRDKKLIQNAFKNSLERGPTGDVDADLLEIRRKLTAEQGEGFHFYRPPLIDQWRTRKKGPPPDDGTLTPKPGPTSPSPGGVSLPEELDAIAAELFLEPPQVLQDWADLLVESRQVIFQGPPGTGKTFIARRLATAVAGSRDRVEVVQFHPSYAYEDFVEGYRPTGAAQFELRDGPVKRIAAQAFYAASSTRRRLTWRSSRT